MKKHLFLLMMAAVAIAFAGCNKNEDPNNPDNVVPDPEGTITTNWSGYPHDIYLTDQGQTVHIRLGWSTPNNLRSEQSLIYDQGPVKGLGGITNPKISGGAYNVACEVGHGYLINRNNTFTFMRLYIVENIIGTTGDITGVKVKYQYPVK
jgi:hypothetical protein